MFGMGGTEILVILIVALLFLGPDKLPEAAKQISKGIRDIKKQSRVLQQTIEDDENIGGAIRDLKSALRGEEEPIRPRPIKAKQIDAVVATAVAGALPEPTAEAAADHPVAEHTDHHDADGHPVAVASGAGSVNKAVEIAEAPTAEAPTADRPALSMPATAGEPDADAPRSTARDDAELAALVKPAPNTIARSVALPPPAALAAPAPLAPPAPAPAPAPLAVAAAVAAPAPAAASTTAAAHVPAAETPDPSGPKHG